MWPFKRRRSPFKVRVRLDGRHPYLSEHHLDVPSKTVTVKVEATGWAEAEVRGIQKAMRENKCWAAWALGISRAEPRLSTRSNAG